MRLSVVVPVYNEGKNILILLNKIKENISIDDEIIVVEDGSVDNTLDEIKKFECKLLIHEKNIGKGQSLIDGIDSAKGDIILFLDGDGQDDPSEIPKLLDGINKGYDFVIGSRFVEDDKKKITRYTKTALSNINWFGNKGLTFFINFLFGLNIKDTQSGFKCFKRDSIKNLNLVSKKYEIETEIIIKSKRDKLKILEVPVFRYERKYGESKLFDIPFGRLIFMLKVLKVIFYGYIFWK
jgi:glycosyltransferase involved in cell wall biosynthesis